ncbi:hypothetical protein [Streptomyces sp. NPDC086519]
MVPTDPLDKILDTGLTRLAPGWEDDIMLLPACPPRLRPPGETP